jgi:SAM-dependent methyltransferase
MLTDSQDAYGHELYDFFKGGQRPGSVMEIVERDDGYIVAHGDAGIYFNDYKKWPPHYKKAMRYVRGRVLDIGCGAGRCSLYLQRKGLDVVGIDISPLAIQVCKERGLRDARVLSISQINKELGIFDTVIMMGNNFGLFGSFAGARRILKKLHKITSGKARIIAETNDAYQTNDLIHLDYHEFNRKRGRMSGQVRIRVRRGKYATPWFDYLMVSKEEMENILKGTGWKVEKCISFPLAAYIAVIVKEKNEYLRQN